MVELNRRLVTGYTQYKDDPRIIQLREAVAQYNRQLRALGLRDHQVSHAHFSVLQAGATIINTGIGWHEARIPTIATKVPRGAFSKVTAKLRGSVNVPLITTNRCRC